MQVFTYKKSNDPMLVDGEYVFNRYPRLTIQAGRGYWMVNLEEGDPDSDEWGVKPIGLHKNLKDAKAHVISEYKKISVEAAI